MQIERAVCEDGDALEAEWWDLWRRDPEATPFQSPAWLLPWRRQFGETDSFVVTLRSGGRLMALLPLFRHAGRLLLWGAGTSDWLDGVFDPALEPAELTPLLGNMDAPLDLFQLRDGSTLQHMPLPEGWTERRAPSEPCIGLALPAKLKKSMAGNLRYYRRRMQRAGVGEPRRADAHSFDDLVELHARRWNERDQPGVLADGRILAWHREALPLLEAAGLLRFYVATLAERTVAALYLLAAKRRAFYYIGGFDPGLAELGLGTVLIGHAIAEAEAEGATDFDFLRGGEAYKYRWGAADQPSHARLLLPPD